MAEAVRVGIGLRTPSQVQSDIEFWKKLGRYITGQAPGTIPHAILRTAGLPGRILSGEQESFSPEEALEFALLATGSPRGGGAAGMGTKVLRKAKKVPKLRSTEEALAFGKKADASQVARLKELRLESLKKHRKLHKAKDFQAAIDEATRGQFFREALEEAGRTKAKPIRISDRKSFSVGEEVPSRGVVDPFTGEKLSSLRIRSVETGKVRTHSYEQPTISIIKKPRRLREGERSGELKPGDIVGPGRTVHRIEKVTQELDPFWIEGKEPTGKWTEISGYSDLKKAEEAMRRFLRSK